MQNRDGHLYRATGQTKQTWSSRRKGCAEGMKDYTDVIQFVCVCLRTGGGGDYFNK